MSKAPSLIPKTTYDLGLVIAANLPGSGLPLEVQDYYLTNKHLIPEALVRGFVLPGQEVSRSAPLVVPTATSFKTANTDLGMWLVEAEEFAKKHLGVEVNFREMFVIPEEIPWASSIPVFDPGGLTNRQALNKVLKMLGPNKPYEEADVMKYSGSEAGKTPTLHLIENSVRPNNDTMELSPDSLVATSKSWLRLRGYALAFALNNFVTNGYLDPQTWTWFPNDRLTSGKVADGCWGPDYAQVKFGWDDPGGESSNTGARLAISVPLKT